MLILPPEGIAKEQYGSPGTRAQLCAATHGWTSRSALRGSRCVVHEQLEIIQTKGHTGTFLELPAGKATLNSLNPGLGARLRRSYAAT